VPALKPTDLILAGGAETSAVVAGRVAQARALQTQRYQNAGYGGVMTNADCPPQLLEEVANLTHDSRKLLFDVSEKMRFSARAYHRVLKVARTLADLDDAPQIERLHLAEAVSYRTQTDVQTVPV